MATNVRGGNRGGNRSKNRNNNPEGRNQYSGLSGTVRANPIATAAAVGGAVAAGVFLWSRRNQISEQLAGLSDQIGEWREGSQSGEGFAGEGLTGTADAREGGRTQAEIAEEALTLKEIGEAV